MHREYTVNKIYRPNDKFPTLVDYKVSNIHESVPPPHMPKNSTTISP